MKNIEDQENERIAIIGMAGKFPKSNNIEEYWWNIRNSVNCSTVFSDEELLKRGVRQQEIDDERYVKRGLLLDDIDQFDADFFSYNKKEAEILDPQQRIFLELAWEALENAGCDPSRFDGSIGIFGGTSTSDYIKRLPGSQKTVTEGLDAFQAMMANDIDFLATRVAYKLNLKGPSFSLQTACSTSLVAIHVACQNLLTYQCDVALAGGVSIRLPQGVGYTYRDGMIWSPDGFCRPFDSLAHGTVFGRGAGVVALKRLSEAVADNDFIYAVIRGSAINNDGAAKVGYTAPSIDGQAEVISLAQAVAGVSPDTIDYIETHGTATKLGDPIEVAALCKAFESGTERTGYCGIGSVKSNIGHLDVAAGVASLIKTTLAIHHKEIPPTLHFQEPNPEIDIDDSPFYIAESLKEWPESEHPRRAGVSAFGIGGTNAHVILEEAPQKEVTRGKLSFPLILPVAAKNVDSLKAMVENITQYLLQNSECNMLDVAYTQQLGRQHFPLRKTIVCRNREEAIDRFRSLLFDASDFEGSGQRRKLAFMFSGQGSQYVHMCQGLYESVPFFKEKFDYCADQLLKHFDTDLRIVLFTPENDALINETWLTQPSLFVTEYCIAQLLLHWGISPDAMVGHSIGEYVAACLAGVFSLEDALMLVVARGRMMQGLAAGDMLSVALPEKDVLPLLPENLSISVVNTPTLTVVSGGKQDIAQFKETLEAEQNIICKILRTSHAFHSSMMDPILTPFVELVKSVKLNKPKMRFVSNVTGTWITKQEAVDPEYWAQHLRQAVRFHSCLQTLVEAKHTLLVEVGPGQVLSMLARQQRFPQNIAVIATSRRPDDDTHDLEQFLQGLGAIWENGRELKWEYFHKGGSSKKIPLPGYAFQRQRYWIDAPLPQESEAHRESKCHCDRKEVAPEIANKSVAIDECKSFVKIEVAKFFSDAIGISPKQLKENISFQDQGFDSLTLTVVASQLSDHFRLSILFRDLVSDFPTLVKLTAHIEQVIESRSRGVDGDLANLSVVSARKVENLVAIQPNGNKTPFIFVHGDEANHYLPGYLPSDQPLYGYLHQSADGEPMRYKKVNEIARYYLDQLVTERPEGPYVLGGFSFGGLVAYEMAYELLKSGQKVSSLIMIDTFNPSYIKPLEVRKNIRNAIKEPLIFINKMRFKWRCKKWIYKKQPIPVKQRNKYILSLYNWYGIFVYQPKPIDCPVLLLKAQETDLPAADNGWASLIGDNLIVENVPGDHLSMLRSAENFQVAADFIVNHLEKKC